MAGLEFKGEIAGVVNENNKHYLLLDSEKKLVNSKKHKLGYMSLIELSKKDYAKLDKSFGKQAFKAKNSAFEGRVFKARNQKVFSFSFEAHADKGFFNIMDSKQFLNDFKKYYKNKKGAKCLNSIKEKDVKVIEGVASPNKKVVEKTIEHLGDVRKNLSKMIEWRKLVDKQKLKIALVFPYYNEPTVVSNIRDSYSFVEEGIVQEIILADGWSKDPGTEIIEERLAMKLPVIKNPGLGKGGAIESAIKYAFYKGYDFVICLDSDIIPPLHLVRNVPPLPIDITCGFFVRNFLDLIFKIVKKYGKKKAMETYYKASYMRIPKKADSLFPLRFGGTTIYVKQFYKNLGFKVMKDCVYPLAGEYAFNPKFMIEKLTISKKLYDLYGKKFTPTIPSGFTIENFWNSLIEAKGLNVAFANMFIHHHIPRGAKVDDKLAYAKQRGVVFKGGYGALLENLTKKDAEKYKEDFDFDLYRIPRPRLHVKIKGKKVSEFKYL